MMNWICLALLTIFLSFEIQASTSLKEFFERCLPDCIHPHGEREPPRLEQRPPIIEEQASLLEGDLTGEELVNPCVVCQERASDTYNTACGHLATCKGCAEAIKGSTNSNCPICRKEMTTLKTVLVTAACALCSTVAPNTMNEACSHLCMCNGCVDQKITTLERCPVCEQPITRYIELYRADGSF